MFWAAASPAGWPPPQHGAAARRRRAAAPQNTTESHSVTLCMESKWDVEEALRDMLAVRMDTSLFALGYLIHPIDFGA